MYDTFKDPLLQEFLRRRENLGAGTVPHMSKSHIGNEKLVGKFFPIIDETKAPILSVNIADLGVAIMAIVATLFIQGRSK